MIEFLENPLSKKFLIKLKSDFSTKKFASLGQKFDEVWYMTPCSPLINYNDLIKEYNGILDNFNNYLKIINKKNDKLNQKIKNSWKEKLSSEPDIIVRDLQFTVTVAVIISTVRTF